MAAIYQRSERINWLSPTAFVRDYKGALDSAMEGAAMVMAGTNAMQQIQMNKNFLNKSAPSSPAPSYFTPDDEMAAAGLGGNISVPPGPPSGPSAPTSLKSSMRTPDVFSPVSSARSSEENWGLISPVGNGLDYSFSMPWRTGSGTSGIPKPPPEPTAPFTQATGRSFLIR